MKRIAALAPLLALAGCSWLGLGPLDWISVAFARIDPDLFGFFVGVACFWVGWYFMGSTSMLSKDWTPPRRMPPSHRPPTPPPPWRARRIGPNCANCGAPHEPHFCSFCLTPSPEPAGAQRVDVTTLEDDGPRYVLTSSSEISAERKDAILRAWPDGFAAVLHEGEAVIPRPFEPDVTPVRPDQPDGDPR